jgi:hypothetical protein
MDGEEYIGDGVYASFDGYQVWLRAERDGMQHRIAIEDQTWLALVSYIERKPWTLSERDSAAFVGSILDAPEPNEALKAAAERHKEAEQ